MKIPGFERDEDGTLVIEISPTMRLVALAGAMIFVGLAVWWVAIDREQEKQRRISRVPGNILPTDQFAEDKPDQLMSPEQSIGVSPYSLLSIESVAGADREELEKIFDEILERGLPDLQSEEAQLYNGLIARSAEIAPNRSLRFYDMLEGGNQRAYSISQLYKRWIELKPTEAVETAKLVEEPLRFHTLSRDLLLLAENNPNEALQAALLTRNDYFQHVEPDFIRPVVRTWGMDSFDAAEEAAMDIPMGEGRKEAIQGLALAKLDIESQWSQAYQWASNLGNSQDRLWTQLTIVEMGIHRGVEDTEDAVNNFSNLSLKKHLLRLVEARRLAQAYPEEERHRQTWILFRSTDPYDQHGRLCVLNAMENPQEREREAIRLRSRWPEVGAGTFVADAYLLTSEVNTKIPAGRLVNRLERGSELLANGDLDASRADFLTYLHYNPGQPELDPYFTEWSKKAGTWLGPGATKLDEISVPATVVQPDTDFFEVMGNLAKRYAEQTDDEMEFIVFEAISGTKPTPLFAWGEHEEVSLREAIDSLTNYSGMIIEHKEYGVVCYHWRDEDIAMSMGSPIELIPYHME